MNYIFYYIYTNYALIFIAYNFPPHKCLFRLFACICRTFHILASRRRLISPQRRSFRYVSVKCTFPDKRWLHTTQDSHIHNYTHTHTYIHTIAYENIQYIWNLTGVLAALLIGLSCFGAMIALSLDGRDSDQANREQKPNSFIYMYIWDGIYRIAFMLSHCAYI